MDRQTIFRRTAEGQDEIKTRRRGLDHNHRFALIMIDGTSDVAQLEAKSAGQWDTEAMLQDLQSMGLIEAANNPPANAPVVDPKAQTGGSGAAPRFKRPEDVKTAMIAAVREIMGERGGEKLITRIQDSQPTAMALADAVDSGCIFIKLTVSEEKAKLLKERLHAILSARF